MGRSNKFSELASAYDTGGALFPNTGFPPQLTEDMR